MLFSVILCFLLTCQLSSAGQWISGTNYCGPGYCAATNISETLCVSNGIWGRASSTGPLDSCCQVHDKCCGTPSLRSPSCNAALIRCIGSVSNNPIVSWFLARLAKDTGFCCSGPCPPRLIQKYLSLHNNDTMTAS